MERVPHELRLTASVHNPKAPWDNLGATITCDDLIKDDWTQ